MEDVLTVIAVLLMIVGTLRFGWLWHKRMTLQIEWYEYKNDELHDLAKKRNPHKYS